MARLIQKLAGDYFFPARIFAHRALAAALILALAAALIVNFFGAGLAGLTDLILAHRAFWAAMILARPAALIFRFFFGAGAATGSGVEPSKRFNSVSKVSISSLRLMTRRNCWTDRLAIEFMLILRAMNAEKSSVCNRLTIRVSTKVLIEEWSETAITAGDVLSPPKRQRLKPSLLS